jgi:hypothetical protein
METIPDYVSLYFQNAKVDGNKYTWNIQQSYYTNTRGNVCYVSLADCIIDAPDDNEIIVKYHGGQNQITSDKEPPVIGLLSMSAPHDSDFGHVQYSASEPIRVLIDARPQTITLQLNNINDSPYNLIQGVNSAVFVLKFEYPPVKKEVENLVDQHYLKL